MILLIVPIIEAARFTGLKYNIKNRTNPLVLATLNAFYGHRYKDWQIDYLVTYKKYANKYYLENCRYSNYMVEDIDYKEVKGAYFYHVKSTYKEAPKTVVLTQDKFLHIPKPFATKIIMSKRETNQEKALQNVDKVFY